MHFSKAVVKHRIPILIAALVLLMIPSVLGMIGTRINYDMLYYLPEDMESAIFINLGCPTISVRACPLSHLSVSVPSNWVLL